MFIYFLLIRVYDLVDVHFLQIFHRIHTVRVVFELFQAMFSIILLEVFLRNLPSFIKKFRIIIYGVFFLGLFVEYWIEFQLLNTGASIDGRYSHVLINN